MQLLHQNNKGAVRAVCLLLALFMLFTSVPGGAFAVDQNGDGAHEAIAAEQTEPLSAATIVAAEPRSGAVHNVNSGNIVQFLSGDLGENSDTFILQENINIPATAHTGRPGTFTGMFFGNNHTITGLRLQNAPHAPTNLGFLQHAGPGAVIWNVTFVAPSIQDAPHTDGWAAATFSAGLIIGSVTPGTQGVLIEGVTITDNAAVNLGAPTGGAVNQNKRAGGLVGRVEAGATLNIVDVDVTVDIHLQNGGADNFGGGLVGENNGNLNITAYGRTYNRAHVRVRNTGGTPFANAGGIVGRSTGGNVVIENTTVSTTTGGIVGSSHAGGAIGHTAAGGSTIIRDVTNTAPVTTTTAGDLGGIIGLAANSTRLYSVANQALMNTTGSGGRNVGGLIGRSSGTVDISIGHNAGEVRNSIGAAGTLGGLIGRSENTARLDNVANRALVVASNAGTKNVGGLIGHSTGVVEITLGHNTGIVRTTSGAAGDIGGMVGLLAGPGGTNSRLHDVENRGQIEASGAGTKNVGGLIGRSTGPTEITIGRNYAEIRHSANDLGRLGGLVGHSHNRMLITDGFNSGLIHRNNTGTAASSQNTGVRGGGIIGRAEHPAAAANQQIILTNVVNEGAIRSTGDARRMHTAGGIIAHVLGGNNAGSVTRITNATNYGAVRASQVGGGMIGLIQTTPRVTIHGGSINYGYIRGADSGSIARRNSSVGGLVGDNNGANTLIEQAGNFGRVWTHHRAAQSSSSARGGAGGIVGRHRTGPITIRETFNAGFISSQGTAGSWHVGGFIGRQQAGGLIEDFYNIGSVRTNTANRGSGIVGRRDAGSMTIRNGYVAATHTGVAVARQATAQNAAVSSFAFSNVYVVNTMGAFGTGASVNRDRLQAHRGGITVMGSDALALGVLPGLNRGPWRVGIQHLTEDQSTLPYFAWQAERAGAAPGASYPQFFNVLASNVAPDFHTLYMPTTAGSVTVAYSGVQRPDTTRLFNVHQTFAHGTSGNLGHRLISHTGGNGQETVTTFANPRRLTAGLLTTTGVVGFGVEADSDVFVIEVVDADCPNNSIIGHASITFPAVPNTIVNDGGILVARMAYIVPNIQTVSVTALGYLPQTNVQITQADYDSRTMQIAMQRTPIDRQINIVVRDGSSEADTPPNITDHTTLLHRGVQHNTRGGTGNTRHFVFAANTVTFGDAMEAGAVGFEWLELAFTANLFDEITGGTGALWATIFLEDIRIPNGAQVHIVEEVYHAETGEIELVPIPNTTFHAFHPPPPERFPANLNWTGTNPLLLNNATTLTILEVGAPGFLSREVIAGDYFEDAVEADPEEGTAATPARIFIVLEREIRFDVHVVEAFTQPNGQPGYRPIPHAALFDNAEEEIPGASGIFTGVVAVAGDKLRATAARFGENTHTVSPDDTGETVQIALARSTPAPGVISGFVRRADDRTTVIPGATVTLINNAGEVAATVTADATGFFQFPARSVPAHGAIYRVIANANTFLASVAEVDPILLTPAAGVVADVYLDRPDPGAPNDVYRVFINVIGAPAGQEEHVAVTFNGNTVARDGTLWVATLNAPTAGEAHATLTGFIPASYSVTSQQFADRGFVFVNLVLGGEVLPGAPGPIRGHVFMAGTTIPIPHASVMVVDAVGTVTRLRVDAGGFFETEPMAPGAYMVMASASGFAPNVSAVNPAVVADSSGVTANVFLESGDLERPFMMAVTVVDTLDQPIPTATVQFNGQALTRTGNNWFYRLPLAIAGTVIAEAEGFRRNSVAVTQADFIESIAFVTVRLEQDIYQTHLAYMVGDNLGNFRPRGQITRAEVATILARTMVSGYSPTASVPDIRGRFSDVNENQWFYRYVAWAYTAGLIQGTDDGRFLPNEWITREQLAAMVARTDTVRTASGFGFVDQGDISLWARNYVYTVNYLGWMHGVGGNRFNPRGDTSRAEMATAVNRILGRSDISATSIAGVLDDIHFFPDVFEHEWFYLQVIEATNSHRLMRMENGMEIWLEILDISIT
ncbi:MAG: S-layer homology domain-containing protein [Oscillospiraceae bacterium]|nr:S-layer homology domain-containing protein [Oscillospiraceae bacterium]